MRLEQAIASDQNPWLAWVAPMAEAVKAARQSSPEDSSFKQAERAASEWISASLDYYRDVRDAASEAQFFQTFGVLFPALLPGATKKHPHAQSKPLAPREQAVVLEALSALENGGYPQALARAACLLARDGEPLPLARFQLKAQLAREYADLLPQLAPEKWHLIRGREEIICHYERDRAVETLPTLLASDEDRRRFLTVIERLLADPRVFAARATPAQRAMLRRIRDVLPLQAVESRPAAAPRAKAKAKAGARTRRQPQA
jgi:hypothetical protein